MRGIYTYKITLSNTTSTATPPNLQVRLNINFSAIKGLSVDLGNIRFSSDQAGNNLLYAWLESAPQGTFTQGTNVSSYTSSNVWVNLGNNIIPANGSLNIYMQVLTSGTEFDGVYWGANPLWTSTYGQYDNGAKVFNNYWNFAGTSLPSNLVAINFGTAITGGSYTQNNGISFNSSVGGGYGAVSNFALSGNYFVDALGYTTASGGGTGARPALLFTVSADTPNPASLVILDQGGYGVNAWDINGANSGTPTNYGSFGSTLNADQYFQMSVGVSGSNDLIAAYPQGSTTPYTYSSYTTANYGGYIGIGTEITSSGITFYWLRVRTYPPNGTDPVLTSIQILFIGNYTSASTPVPAWSILSGKPYVTVSATGISNGLSNIFNDGADFGPDTLLGASSPNQYGPPYTQTSGIQEAINYAFANNITLDIKAGQYIISAPLQQDPNDTGNYYQIGIPYATAFQTLNIICEGYAPIGYSYPGAGTTEQPNDLVYDGPTPVTGVQLLSTNTTGPPANATGSVLYVLKNPNTPNDIPYNGVRIQGALRVTIQPGVALTGINFYHAEFIDADTLMADIDLSASNNIPNPANAIGSSSNSFVYSFVGVSLNKVLTNGSVIRKIYAVGYFTGLFIAGSHIVIDALYVQSCQYAIVTYYYGHYSNIIYANIQECPVTIHNHAGAGSSQLNILSLDMEVNYGVSTGPEAWMNFVTDYETEGGGFHGIIRYHKQGVNMPAGAATTFFMANYEPNIIALPYDMAGLTPTISANPPASGTVYQNTNPYNIRIYLPAYATTSGTAGSVAIALGSSSSPSTIGTKFINGSTSSSATEIIELVVPAGWYYKFTATGVTFGTATVLPA
ncbi:MAG: hypothetical protein QXP36_09825 [Conexivisphaerales archaeon]